MYHIYIVILYKYIFIVHIHHRMWIEKSAVQQTVMILSSFKPECGEPWIALLRSSYLHAKLHLMVNWLSLNKMLMHLVFISPENIWLEATVFCRILLLLIWHWPRAANKARTLAIFGVVAWEDTAALQLFMYFMSANSIVLWTETFALCVRERERESIVV